MSMPTGTTLPYVGSSTENLTLSKPNCNNDSCKAFYLGHQASQAQVSYSHQFDYGHYTAWFYVACIGLLAILYFWQDLRDERDGDGNTRLRSSPGAKFMDKAVARWRSVSYRRKTGWMSDRFGLPSFGILIFFFLVILYLALLSFTVRPYYRLRRGFGSPPLAVRTGLMAVSLTPLIFALAGKANAVTLLTGIGHEKLNLFHRWVGWICFMLSVVHTVPFIVQPLQYGGPAALRAQFYKPGAFEYTGVPPLAMLFGLLLLSLPWIRHRVYQAFYGAHILIALAYLALMFWHCGDEGDSWVYLWVTIFVFVGSVVARFLWFHQSTNFTADKWFSGLAIIAKPLPDGMTCLEMAPPTGFDWLPGQHIFIRVPQVELLGNHPFTIASASKPYLVPSSCLKETPSLTQQPTLRFYIRSREGFTKRLRYHLDNNPDSELKAWIDGPYGGIQADIGLRYDNVILAAGGGGITACLPWLEHFAYRMHAKEKSLRTGFVRLVWSIRHESAMAWIADIVNDLNLESLDHRIEIHLHITGAAGSIEKSDKLVSQQDSSSDEDITSLEGRAELSKTNINVAINSSGASVRLIKVATIHEGRIDMRSLSKDLPRESHTLVVGCGPTSFNVDLSNACAEMQREVLGGRLGSLSLHTETFGW